MDDKDAPAGFGRPIAKSRTAQDRLDDLSGVPEGYPGSKPRGGEKTDSNLDEILKGGVPKS